MVARSSAIFSHAPNAMFVVAVIGALTAIFAASVGLVQYDIKRVMAYSTVSQLGYMFLALGVGGLGVALFHLFSHAWFKALLSWPLETVLPALPGIPEDLKQDLAGRIADKIIPALEEAAAALSLEETVPVALDWMNGRRTPDANQRLTGAITGIRLGTDAPRVYRSLVEATAFGSRAIVERFREQGTRIDSAIAIGGVAKKSRFVMQTVADVMNMEVTVAAGDQTVALGAAMFAATAAGLYRQVGEAQQAMSPGTESVYRPDPARAQRYDQLYKDYLALGSFVESQLTGTRIRTAPGGGRRCRRASAGRGCRA